MAKQSVADEAVCCFCIEPLGGREPHERTLTINTTNGELYVVKYHENCYRAWLGDNYVARRSSHLAETARVYRLQRLLALI